MQRAETKKHQKSLSGFHSKKQEKFRENFMMIRLEHIEKKYGRRAVFGGIDLDVAEGEFVAVMGNSGSGKSTLLNLIGGMDSPDGGRITVAGDVITSFTEEELTRFRRNRIGFIFQFFNLLPNITVYENIELPLLLGGKKGYEARITSYMKQAGLDRRERDLPSTLSGGEQQRVAIVRALAADPAVILADEPTGNLDSRTGEAIMELIRRVAAGGRKTVVLTTHNRDVADLADRIVRIEDGELHSWTS
jgi:putative ABC transport system ATP-binding protein